MGETKVPKTETEINFEQHIKDMMTIIEEGNVKVSDARKLVMKSVNLLERYKEMKRSRDNHRTKRYEAEKKLKVINNGS